MEEIEIKSKNEKYLSLKLQIVFRTCDYILVLFANSLCKTNFSGFRCTRFLHSWHKKLNFSLEAKSSSLKTPTICSC